MRPSVTALCRSPSTPLRRRLQPGVLRMVKDDVSTSQRTRARGDFSSYLRRAQATDGGQRCLCNAQLQLRNGEFDEWKGRGDCLFYTNDMDDEKRQADDVKAFKKQRPSDLASSVLSGVSGIVEYDYMRGVTEKAVVAGTPWAHSGWRAAVIERVRGLSV